MNVHENVLIEIKRIYKIFFKWRKLPYKFYIYYPRYKLYFPLSTDIKSFNSKINIIMIFY